MTNLNLDRKKQSAGLVMINNVFEKFKKVMELPEVKRGDTEI